VDNNLDICTITETWLSSCSERDRVTCGDMTPAGYTLLHAPRKTGRGGGVAVILKSTITTKIQKRASYTSFELMEILCTAKSACIRLVIVYRPPSDSKSTFLKEFRSYMDSLIGTTGMLLVTGDFNIHVDDQYNADGVNLNNLLYSMNLINM